MKSFSADLRQRVLASCEEGALTQGDVAEEFGVSVAFITKLRRRYREDGTVACKPRGGNRRPSLDRRDLAALRRLVREQPDATLAELRQRLRKRRGIKVGLSTLWRALGRQAHWARASLRLRILAGGSSSAWVWRCCCSGR